MSAQKLITDHLDLWTGAVTHKRGTGRGASGKNGKIELTGIKKLRELILELAVRGKLVEQDPNDESASVLLEKIAEEKARLVKEGKLKKPKKLPEINQEEVTAELPTTWSWARLGEITNYGVSEKAEPGEVEDTSWVLELEDIEKESSRLLQRVLYKDRPFKSSKNRFIPGNVLYGKLRPYLDKVFVADRPGVCTTEIIPIHGFHGICPFYLRIALKSPAFKSYANDATHGMNLPRLGTDRARMAVLPLPPKEEQSRIAEKVDELMALCDRLEQQVGGQLEAHEVLVDSILDALTRSTDAAELAESWARVAEHFDTLFATEASIDKLRQTVLQLAISGRLTEAVPNETPASVLLEEISKEKDRLTKEGNLRKQKKLSPVKKEEHPFALPENWTWCRLSDVASVVDPNPSHRMPKYIDNGIPFISTENFSSNDTIDFSIGKKVDSSVLQEQVEKFEIRKGAFAISRIGTIGKTRFLPEERNYCMSHALCVISPLTDAFNYNYLRFVVSAESSLSQANHGVQSIGVPDLGVGVIRSLLIPIPPVETQQHIVEKVDELMALCDQLKTRLGEAGETRSQLAETVVEQAVS